MARLPAVAGLLKHQLYYSNPQTGHPQGVVQTFWTWKNHDPVPQSRIDAEVATIIAWVNESGWRNSTWTATAATAVKTWDFGTTPPVRKAYQLVWPNSPGAIGSASNVYQLTVVIALRTQPVGSAVRNRLNGRTHHPYPGQAVSTGGVWSSGFSATVLAAYNSIRTRLNPAFNALHGTWVVPCWFEGGALRAGGPLLPAVNHVLVRPQPGIQRRRAEHPGPYARGA